MAQPQNPVQPRNQTRPRDRRRAETRREIVDAAWVQCRAGGLAALSLRELAGRVGLQAPSLYSYFDSKNAIYDAMFAQGQQELLDRLRQLPDEQPTREDFLAGARAFFDFCTEDPVRYQLLFQRTVPGFEPTPDSYALALDVLALLGDRLASNGLTDPRHVDLWTALVTGLVDQQISNDPGGDRWSRLLPEAVDLFLGHVLPPPPPSADE